MEIRQTGIEPQIIGGTIQSHRGRGRQLGIPTINVPAPADTLDGVYAGFVVKDQRRFPAAIFIGAAVTFGETDRQAEAHILDAEVDMVGAVQFELTQFIRANQKFPEADRLRQQMAEDINVIRQCLQGSSKNS